MLNASPVKWGLFISIGAIVFASAVPVVAVLKQLLMRTSENLIILIDSIELEIIL